MNKALINKYWKEFCHWKDGGEILVRHHNDSWKLKINTQWDYDGYPISYIINDEYVEYRKALAEGKTVEMHGEVTFQWVKMCSDNFELKPSDYRIKPDEPEFKVGDYVSHINVGCIVLIGNKPNSDKMTVGVDEVNDFAHLYKLWTFEEADDDELVLAKFGSPICLMSVKDVKKQIDQMNNPRDCVPYICQTAKQLGLKK